MTGARALEILAALHSHRVAASVDGGWGVDALIGRQTRPHEDLDLVVALGDVDAITSALRPLGYSVAEDHLPVRFVMRDAEGAQLDFHTVAFDEQGGGVQPQPGGGSFHYPPEGFVRGRIAGEEVACISAQVQVLCHLGYEPTSKDAHDVLLLCSHLDLAVPPAYRCFAESTASMSVSRVIPATCDEVFAAFTVPGEIKNWHVPGPDFRVCIAEVDLRIGGSYRIGMQPPDRAEPHTFYGVYREVSPPNRLVYTSNWEPPDRDTGETLVTIELRANGASTEVRVAHELLPDQQSADDHTRGWTGTLESLARHFV